MSERKFYYIYTLFVLFMAQPLVEYFIHRLLHIRHKYSWIYKKAALYHKSHHDRFINLTNYSKYYGGHSIYLIVGSGYYIFPDAWLLWMCLLKYEISHTLVHAYPDLFVSYANHHKIHHLYPKYNYSFSAIWPDKLFNTYKHIKPSAI